MTWRLRGDSTPLGNVTFLVMFYSALLSILGCLLAANGFMSGSSPVVVRRGLAGGLLAGSISGTRPSPTSTPLATTKTDAGGDCAPAASTSLSRKPRPGDIVTFTMLSFEAEGGGGLEPPFDTDGTRRLRLDGGNYLPGLHSLLSTMSPGETVRGATLDAGYGSYRPEAVFEISTDDLGSLDRSAVKVGTRLQMGNGVTVRVTSIT